MGSNHFIAVYEQYWLHARHQEVQRLWFANIYAVIVAGIFAYFGAIKDITIDSAPLLVFVILFSLLAYTVTYSWNIPFTIFTRLAEEIAVREWSLQEDYRRFTKYKKGYKYQKRIGGMEASANTAFMAFYSLMTGVFSALLVQLFTDICVLGLVLIGVIVFVALFLYYKFFLKKKSIDEIQNEFENRIRESEAQEN